MSMTGETGAIIYDSAISESVRPFVRKIDPQEQFRLPDPKEIPGAIRESVKNTIDGAKEIPWESASERDFSFEENDSSGLVCFKIPDDLALIPLYERELFIQLNAMQDLGEVVVEPLTMMIFDPRLEQIIREAGLEGVKGETLLNHELKHALELAGDERAEYINIRFVKTTNPDGMGIFLFHNTLVQIDGDLLESDLSTLLAPDHPSIDDIMQAHELVNKALLSATSPENIEYHKEISEQINHLKTSEATYLDIYPTWLKEFRRRRSSQRQNAIRENSII